MKIKINITYILELTIIEIRSILVFRRILKWPTVSKLYLKTRISNSFSEKCSSEAIPKKINKKIIIKINLSGRLSI